MIEGLPEEGSPDRVAEEKLVRDVCATAYLGEHCQDRSMIHSHLTCDRWSRYGTISFIEVAACNSPNGPKK
jgi:hypothetical protein